MTGAALFCHAMGCVSLALLSSGCASLRSSPAPGDAPLAGGRIIDARSGRALSPAEVDQRLLAAQVILVGEEHATPMYQTVQREVLERVEALDPRHTALGIEWLPRSATLALDDFVTATPPESLAALRAAVDWDAVWGHDFDAYADIFESARRQLIPIVALNAEPGLARLVARHGVAGVPPERTAELPPLDSGNADHRDWFRARMQAASEGHPGHSVSGAAFERMYLAQLVWDETMARSISEALIDVRRIVVFAGLGHVEQGLGIPARLGAGVARLIIVPVASADDARSRARDAELPMREADLFWVAREAVSPAHP